MTRIISIAVVLLMTIFSCSSQTKKSEKQLNNKSPQSNIVVNKEGGQLPYPLINVFL